MISLAKGYRATPSNNHTYWTYHNVQTPFSSALFDLIAAPVLAAALHSRPMLDTDSALYDLFAAPVLAAALHYRTMLDTDSALLG